jgi:hypothetical protein
MTEHNSSFGIVAGVLAVFVGTYSLSRTSSVASWLARHGLHHSPATATLLRQIKTLAVLFILAGGFFVFVAVRNR